MVYLDSLEVTISGIEISSMCLSVNIQESIKGGIKGTIVVQDNINFYDTFIGQVQPDIMIAFGYIDNTCEHLVVSDGITDMSIQEKGKTYTIHFISNQSIDFKNSLINHSYAGTSHEIIRSIFTEACNKEAIIQIDTPAITKGKYVVPNIVAGKAIKYLLDTAFDINASQLCLYQRLWDEGTTRLTSYHDMNRRAFTNAQGEPFEIKKSSVSLQDNSKTVSVGSSSSFKIMETGKDFSGKVAAGHYGQSVTHIELDDTKQITYKSPEITKQTITKFKLSKDLFDEGVSIFTTAGDPVTRAAMNQRKRLYNQYLQVNDVVAIPFVGVGMSMNVDSGMSNISSSRQKGKKFIIDNIDHKFTLDDGEFSYYQDMGLIRE